VEFFQRVPKKLGLDLSQMSRRTKIISYIEDEEVIDKILSHLGLWEAKTLPPKVNFLSTC
jgi:hypothetical protein